MPRTTKLSPAVQDKICAAIRAGMYQHRAAIGAGVSETTFYRWMEQGDPANQHNEPALNALPLETLRAAAKSAGITITNRTPRETIIDLLDARDLGSWRPYREFREAVLAAEHDLEQRLIAQIQTASAPITKRNPATGETEIVDPGKPQHLLTLLARRFKHWSPTASVEVTGKDGGPIEVSVEQRLADKLEAYKQGVADALAVQEERQQVEPAE